MGIVVNTNSTAMYSNMYLSRANEGVKESMQKLSSGSRITSAKDDAAGLGISNQLTALRRGLGVAVRNGNDALSISQVAEGAMVEQTEMLLRMRDLALQAANGSNGEEQRLALDAEMQQLQVELTRIADTTTFGTEKLLNGFFEEKAFQVGSNAWEHLSIDIGNASASAMGFKYFKTEQDDLTIIGSNSVAEVGGIKNVRTLEVQVDDNTYKIDLEYAMTSQELEDKINSIRGISDINVDLLNGTGTSRAIQNAGLESANIYKQMGLNIDNFSGSGTSGANMVLSFEVYNEFTKEIDEYDFNVDLSGVTDTETLTQAVRDAINLKERKGFSQASGDKTLRGLRAGAIGDAIVLEFRASEKYKQPVSFVAMQGGATGLKFDLLTDEEAWSSTGSKKSFAAFDGTMQTFSKQTFEKQTALEAQEELVRGELGEPELMPLDPALPSAPRSAVIVNELKLTAEYDDLVNGDELTFDITINGKPTDAQAELIIDKSKTFNEELFAEIAAQVAATDFDGAGAGAIKLGGDQSGFYLVDGSGELINKDFELDITLDTLAAKESGTGSAIAGKSFFIAVEDSDSQYAEQTIVFERPATDTDAALEPGLSIALTAAPTVVSNPVANIDPYDPNAGVAGGNNKYFDFKYASSFDINVDLTPKGAGADYADDDLIAFKFDVVNASAPSGTPSLGSVEVEVKLADVASTSIAEQIQEAIQVGLSGMQSTDKTVAFSMDDKGEFLIHTTDENATFKLLGEMTEHTIGGNDADSSVSAGDAQFSVDVQLQLPSTTRSTSMNSLTSTDRSQTLSTSVNNVSRVSPPQYRGSNWAGFTVGDMAYNVPGTPAAYNVEMSFDVRDAEGNTHNFKSEVEIGLDAATSAANIASTFEGLDSDKGVKLADINMSIVADGDAFVIGYSQPDSDTPESVQVSNLAVKDAATPATAGDTFSLTGLSGTASYARSAMVYDGATAAINDSSKYVLFDNRMSTPVDTDFVPANFVLDFDNFKAEEYVTSVAFKIDEKSFGMQADIDLSEELYFNSVAAVNIRTFEATQEALVAIDAAMTSISAVRADLGAIQNRVVHTGNNNNNIQVQVAEANSRILDLDYAEESTQLAKVQVLQQTSASMLTQANQITQLAVQLVQG